MQMEVLLLKIIHKAFSKDGSGPIKEEKLRLKLVKNVFLTEVDGDGLTYAYDTKLKKVVLINPANNYRIMFIVD